MRVTIAALNCCDNLGDAMAEIIRLQDHKRNASEGDYPIITKVVDGEIVECVNFDTLTSAQYSKYLSQFPDIKI
jgi:hypothetical protein